MSKAGGCRYANRNDIGNALMSFNGHADEVKGKLASINSAISVGGQSRRSDPTGSMKSTDGQGETADRRMDDCAKCTGRPDLHRAVRRTPCPRSAASAINLAVQDAVAAAKYSRERYDMDGGGGGRRNAQKVSSAAHYNARNPKRPCEDYHEEQCGIRPALANKGTSGRGHPVHGRLMQGAVAAHSQGGVCLRLGGAQSHTLRRPSVMYEWVDSMSKKSFGNSGAALVAAFSTMDSLLIPPASSRNATGQICSYATFGL